MDWLRRSYFIFWYIDVVYLATRGLVFSLRMCILDSNKWITSEGKLGLVNAKGPDPCDFVYGMSQLCYLVFPLEPWKYR